MAMRTSYYHFALASAAFARPSTRPNISPLCFARNLSSFSTGRPAPPRRRRRGATAFPPRGTRNHQYHTPRRSQPLHFSSFSSCHDHGAALSPRRSPSVASARTDVPTTAFSSTHQRNILNTLPRHARPAAVRLFGSRPDAPDARPGALLLADDRESSAVPVDLAALRRTVAATRDVLGYPTYDVSLSLVDDEFMKEINGAARGVAAPTDVLSFCFQDDFAAPGALGPVQFDRAEYYNLGDMLIDVDYVRRKCEEDRNLHGTAEWKSRQAAAAQGDASEGVPPTEEGHEDDGYEYEYVEVEVDEYDDRGVAPAMQYVYEPEIRIHMLVVHGMLHLVGYDHIEDDDYELMVVREDEVLAELRRRLGEDFGVTRRLPAGDGVQRQLC